MEALVGYFQSAPLPLSLAGAYWLPYAALAWAAILVRVFTGCFRKIEWALLAVFAASVLIEAIQLAVDGFKFSGESTWGLPRYFGVFAPLFWVWSAYALSWLWSASANPLVRNACRIAIVAAIGWLAVFPGIIETAGLYAGGARADVETATAKIAKIIKADYAGPSRQSEAKRTMKEYFTTRRPVVFGDFSAAAWAVRGQSEGAAQGFGLCPYEPDYVCFRLYDGGYRSPEERFVRNPRRAGDYEYLGSVHGGEIEGERTSWRIYRRRATPGRSRAPGIDPDTGKPVISRTKTTKQQGAGK